MSIPKVAASSSSETLTGINTTIKLQNNLIQLYTDATVLSAPCSPSNLSSVTLVDSSYSDSNEVEITPSPHYSPKKNIPSKTEFSSLKNVPQSPEAIRVESQHKPIIKHEVSDKKIERGASEETEGIILFSCHLFMKQLQILLYF